MFTTQKAKILTSKDNRNLFWVNPSVVFIKYVTFLKNLRISGWKSVAMAVAAKHQIPSLFGRVEPSLWYSQKQQVVRMLRFFHASKAHMKVFPQAWSHHLCTSPLKNSFTEL